VNPESSPEQRITQAISERYGATLNVDPATPGLETLADMLERRSHRRFAEREVSADLLQLLYAAAFSAPSKSDLQQADIVHVKERPRVAALATLVPDMPWVAVAPVLLVFCGNNRRIRQIGSWRGKPFVNNHLDHFMNAAVDAGIVLANFIRAAEAVGLGCCPISALRNHPRELNELLQLPEGVFPVAGLAAGYPAEAGRISARLPLDVTVHVDHYDESRAREHIENYDRRRHVLQPFRKQRHAKRYEPSEVYGWSEDKARQYSVPERADFGAYIRKQGFTLD
jgi:FMN reductase [NAD(P)H]